ncbi:MAG: hypothetical protein NTW59_02615 [Candidatus Diapherotrites archaeon]|nr:hypothetical protein [Candidatus Diapherotrites archaeon]
MILGIDFGASNTGAVLLDGKRLVKKASTAKTMRSKMEIELFLKKNKFNSFNISGIAITGGKSAFFKQKIFGIKPLHVDEIQAIGRGASFLAGAKRCLAVSTGTGTCVVLFEKGKSKHVIGSGLGGGTILGLSKLLVRETRISELIGLARRGNLRNVDLSVGDIVGGGIGIVNSKATGSNFAKMKNFGKADLAAGVQNMVAEAVAVLAISASRGCKCGEIVFVGRAACFPLVRERLLLAAKLFGAKFVFPKDFAFGTAVGAALSKNSFK